LVVSEAVSRQLDPSSSKVEDLGPVELKGHPQPVRLFKLA
jgi:class 3 adenylate cyclase